MMGLESDKYKVGDTVKLVGGVFENVIKGKPMRTIHTDGVIVKKKDIPWGFNFVVQLVNTDGIFFDRGELVDAKPEMLVPLKKILPR